MLDIDSALIVDRSKVMRHILTTILKPHARVIRAATGFAEARAQLGEFPETALILCELQLDDGDGFDLVDFAAAQLPRCHVILMTHRHDVAGAERARASGALGLVTKPISMSDLSRVWAQASDPEQPARNARVRERTQARLVDAGAKDEQLISWRVRNLSTNGAFLETKGPIAIGETLELEIETGPRLIRVSATVVRLQEPTWLCAGGVGIRFDTMDDASREALCAYVEMQARVDDEIDEQRGKRSQSD